MKEASCAAPQADAAIEKVKEASGTADAGTADGEGDSSLPGAVVTEKAVEASGNAAADADVDGKAEHSSLPSVSDAVSSTEDKPAAVTEPPLTMKEASCAAPQADAAIEKVKEASGTADAGTADGEGDSSLPGAAVTEKAVEASGNAAAAADADVDGKAEHSSLPSVSDAVSSTEDKPAAVTEPPLTAEELLKLTERARALVEAGRVFAVQEVKGMLWRSLITLDFGRLHLYFLQGLSIPDNAHTVQMSDVVPVAPPCEVFLDVLCPGTPLRRVSVSLPRDTPFGRQFLLMCSGQRGVSYANTKLFKVWHKNRQGESVWGGDYQDNNGRKGAALLPDLDNSDQYWPSCKVGSIWPPGFGPRQSTQFSVITRECDPDDGFPIIFAEVVRGIEVFQEAATYKPVNNVVIQQCGVLLSQ